MISRRSFALASCAVGFGLLAKPALLSAAANPWSGLPSRLAEIERKTGGGRLGVQIHDLATGLRVGYRADEAFPMCSTFKLLAAAAILSRVDGGREDMDRRVVFGPEQVVTYSPATKDHAGSKEGMRLADICRVAITQSDNTAANLMLDAIGGPAGLTAFARGLGDQATRLDRIEPELNSAIPGDPRDTTTPAAMAEDIERLVLGDALSVASRGQLTDWLCANTTGAARLKAGLPGDWRIGDKTGSGSRGTANDVGVVWPLHRAPLVVTAYLTSSPATMDQCNEALAAIGRAVAEAVGE